MAKFGSQTESEEPTPKIAMDQLPPPTKPSFGSSIRGGSSSSMQLSDSAQLAKIDLEKQQWVAQEAKQEEHWVKQYWRPSMGWLYMVICACDFVVFPLIAMFMPVFIKMQYIPWNSITLDNGGLIHLSFGAILGVAAWTRGQEKIVGKN
jgi:hypothetical protein